MATLLDPDSGASALVLRDVHSALIKVDMLVGLVPWSLQGPAKWGTGKHAFFLLCRLNGAHVHLRALRVMGCVPFHRASACAFQPV